MLAAFGGNLLGADRGEWAGELVFRDAGGVIHPLLDQNVRGIARMPFGVIVFTGVAHLGVSKGAVYRVDQSPDGALAATLIRRLPGSPEELRRTTRGDLAVRVDIEEWHPHDWFHLRDSRTSCLRLDRTGKFHRQLCMAIIQR